MGNAENRRRFERAIVGNVKRQQHGGRAAHHVLHRRERGALTAELGLRRRGMRIGLKVAAGVHHHAELGEHQRQRQHMHEPAAIASDQSGLRRRVSPAFRVPTSSTVESYNAVTRTGVRTSGYPG